MGSVSASIEVPVIKHGTCLLFVFQKLSYEYEGDRVFASKPMDVNAAAPLRTAVACTLLRHFFAGKANAVQSHFIVWLHGRRQSVPVIRLMYPLNQIGVPRRSEYSYILCVYKKPYSFI